jgi:hypothetical protein
MGLWTLRSYISGEGGVKMDTEKKEFVAPEYTVVKFDSKIVMEESGEDCMEIHSWLSGTDCHEQEMYLPQGN